MNATGKNTAISDKVVAKTARPISFVPLRAASTGSIPFSSTFRKMISKTTIASSITIPTASAKASKVMVSSVKPSNHMHANVPTIEVGMAMAAISVLRTLPRNTSTTRAAKMAPRIKCSFTASTLVRITPESSRTSSSL